MVRRPIPSPKPIHGIFAILSGPGIGNQVVLGPFDTTEAAIQDDMVKEADDVLLVMGTFSVTRTISIETTN